MNEIIIAILALFAVALLFVIYQKQRKIKQMKHRLETLNKLLNNHETTIHYMRPTLTEQLQRLRALVPKNMIPVKHKDKLHISSKDIDWKTLYHIFNGLYNGFVNKLDETYPGITEKERRFCCLLRANFNIEEITFILGYETTDSTHTQKNKLRKKLGFAETKKLTLFLENL